MLILPAPHMPTIDDLVSNLQVTKMKFQTPEGKLFVFFQYLPWMILDNMIDIFMCMNEMLNNVK